MSVSGKLEMERKRELAAGGAGPSSSGTVSASTDSEALKWDVNDLVKESEEFIERANRKINSKKSFRLGIGGWIKKIQGKQKIEQIYSSLIPRLKSTEEEIRSWLEAVKERKESAIQQGESMFESIDKSVSAYESRMDFYDDLNNDCRQINMDVTRALTELFGTISFNAELIVASAHQTKHNQPSGNAKKHKHGHHPKQSKSTTTAGEEEADSKAPLRPAVSTSLPSPAEIQKEAVAISPTTELKAETKSVEETRAVVEANDSTVDVTVTTSSKSTSPTASSAGRSSLSLETIQEDIEDVVRPVVWQSFPNRGSPPDCVEIYSTNPSSPISVTKKRLSNPSVESFPELMLPPLTTCLPNPVSPVTARKRLSSSGLESSAQPSGSTSPTDVPPPPSLPPPELDDWELSPPETVVPAVTLFPSDSCEDETARPVVPDPMPEVTQLKAVASSPPKSTMLEDEYWVSSEAKRQQLQSHSVSLQKVMKADRKPSNSSPSKLFSSLLRPVDSPSSSNTLDTDSVSSFWKLGSLTVSLSAASSSSPSKNSCVSPTDGILTSHRHHHHDHTIAHTHHLSGIPRPLSAASAKSSGNNIRGVPSAAELLSELNRDPFVDVADMPSIKGLGSAVARDNDHRELCDRVRLWCRVKNSIPVVIASIKMARDADVVSLKKVKRLQKELKSVCSGQSSLVDLADIPRLNPASANIRTPRRSNSIHNMLTFLGNPSEIPAKASDFLSNSLHSTKSFRTPEKQGKAMSKLRKVFSGSSKGSDESSHCECNSDSLSLSSWDGLDQDIRAQLKGAKWLSLGKLSSSEAPSLSRQGSFDSGSHSEPASRESRAGTDCSDAAGDYDPTCFARECAEDIRALRAEEMKAKGQLDLVTSLVNNATELAKKLQQARTDDEVKAVGGSPGAV